ncbi:hypothetical protein V8B97DRAFT_1876081 [Scleroderma yunnanense]
MALTLPATPSSIRSDSSSSLSSDESSVPPQSPDSLANNAETITSGSQKSHNNNNNNTGANTTAAPKKKASRRANTAERKATHNAVERARRETLNGRFLDLAALLPNLSQIRRPSKSAIVNSSIAYVHSSRRHRLLASRELRILKSEADALRRELNDWHDRAGLPRVEEPIRSEGFGIVLSGEVEVISLGSSPGMLDEDDGAFDGFDECDEDFVMSHNTAAPMSDDGDDVMAAGAMLKIAHTSPAATAAFGNPNTNLPSGPLAQPHVISRGSGPSIAQTPPSVSFENPVMPVGYEPQAHFGGAYFMDQGQQQQYFENDKITTWAPGYAHPNAAAAAAMVAYHTHTQGQQQRAMVITPPTQAGSPSSAEHAQILASMKRHQHLLAMHQQAQHQMSYPVLDADDTASVLSSRSGSERDIGEICGRSGSASTGYGSPRHGSSPVIYDSPVNYESSVRYEHMGSVAGGVPGSIGMSGMTTGMGGGSTGMGMCMDVGMMKQGMVSGYGGMM